MKWLVRLYPKQWRTRYGEEFLDILENRKLSLGEVLDVIVNALDARILHLAEGTIQMDKKVRGLILGSKLNRSLILGSIMVLGLFGGYWLASSNPSVLELPPVAVLFIGAGLGLFAGYVAGVARGIMRVMKAVEKEDVFVPAGKLRLDRK